MSEQPGQEQPGKKPNDQTPKTGWIENLAQRSTGLPDDKRPAVQDQGKSPWTYAGKGLQFAATSAIFALIGLFVDRRYGWTPWGMVGFSAVGFTGGLYLLVKDALKDEKGERK